MVTRIAFLNTHPIQYKAPLYAYLNSANDLDITALYMSDFSIRGSVDEGFRQSVKWDVDLLSGYRAVFLGKAARTRRIGGFFSMVAPELWSEIRSGRYDALVIHGHNFAGCHIALAAAKSIDLPVFMRAETHLGLHRSGARAALREPLMRFFYRRFSGFFAIGTANAEFYRAMNVPAEKIFHVPYTVDNDRFRQMSELGATERNGIRERWGVTDDRPVILFAAKFQARKHPDDLIRACAVLAKEGLSFHLLMVGSGEREMQLRALAAEMLPGSITFTGFMNQSDLPRAYAASDVFVLPSTNEPWGLAINEVMAAGLPVVASREVGAVRDLVHDGVNGRIFEARNIGALAGALRDVIADPARIRVMRTASRDIISRWSYRECLEGVRVAIKSLPARHRTRAA